MNRIFLGFLILNATFTMGCRVRNVLLALSVLLGTAGFAHANSDQFDVFDSEGSYLGVFSEDDTGNSDRTLFRDSVGTYVGFSRQNRTYDSDGSFLGYVQDQRNEIIFNDLGEFVGFVGGYHSCHLFDSQSNFRGFVRLRGASSQNCSADNSNKAAAFLLFLNK
jgi:hypothetical protein